MQNLISQSILQSKRVTKGKRAEFSHKSSTCFLLWLAGGVWPRGNHGLEFTEMWTWGALSMRKLLDMTLTDLSGYPVFS